MSSNTSNFYKEAITKLRYLLSDPDNQQTTKFDNNNEKKNDDPMKTRQVIAQLNVPVRQRPSNTEESTRQHSELTNFTQQLQLYLRHLQEERNFLRDEISTLVSKVMEIILENDNLRQNQTYYLPLMKSTSISESDYDGTENSDYRNVSYSENHRDKFSRSIGNTIWNSSGYKVASPSQGIVDIHTNGKYRNDSTIYHESRISELQAHLTETRMQLNKAQNELELYKRKEKKQDKQRCENMRNMKNQQYEQIEMLHSANREINDIIGHLQVAAYNLPANEATTMMIRPTQNLRQNNFAGMEQARFEKLRERFHIKQEAEQEYGDQIEKLLAELQEQWNENSQLRTQISRRKQTELELRQELTRRNNFAQDTMNELNTKIYELETELSTARAGKESSEREMVNGRMQLEQANYRTQLNDARYQETVADLKQRLYRTEMESARSREENVRLRERIASLEKELTILAKEELDSQRKNNQQLTDILYKMDDKRGKQVSNLENRMQSQSQLIDSLKEECRMLTGKQDEQENRHKEEIAGLQNNVEYLNNKINYDITQVENTWNDETNYPVNL